MIFTLFLYKQFKEEAVLQAGVEIIYPSSNSEQASNHFKKIADIANNHYGKGVPIDLGGVENLNYGDTKSVFYIVKGNANEHPFYYIPRWESPFLSITRYKIKNILKNKNSG